MITLMVIVIVMITFVVVIVITLMVFIVVFIMMHLSDKTVALYLIETQPDIQRGEAHII